MWLNFVLLIHYNYTCNTNYANKPDPVKNISTTWAQNIVVYHVSKKAPFYCNTIVSVIKASPT